MKQQFFIIITLFFTLSSCYTATEKGIQCGTDECVDACDIAQDAPTEFDALEETGEAVETLGLVGDPCKADNECQTNFCLTTTFLKTLGLEIPGLDPEWGICSKLFCVDDNECGKGGKCFDTMPFTGESIKVCLRSCEKVFDCAYTAGESCFGEETQKACLPNALIAAIVCGDGICDTNEEVTGSCPDDCNSI